jgi:O-antigen ligase
VAVGDARGLIGSTTALLAWAVLAFGAVYTWAWIPLLIGAATIGVAGLRFSAATLNHRLAAALAATVGAVALQLVPLPGPILDSFSPAASRFLAQYDLAQALSSARVFDASAIPPHPLSIDPAATRVGALFFLSFSLLFLGLSAALTARHARALADSVLVVSLAIALVGIVQERFGGGRLYGFWQPLAVTEPFGPFVNRNHFGGWMLMAIPLCLGRLCDRVARAPGISGAGWRRWLIGYAAPPSAWIVIGAAALGVMALSLVMTTSRSAMLSLVAALALSAVLITRRQRGWQRGMTAALLIALPGVAAAWTGIEVVLDRFTASSSADLLERATAWQDAAAIIRDFAAAGTGVNTYGTATILHAHPSLTMHYTAAHSDYLQLAAEGGLLVGLPAVVAAVLFAGLLRTRLREAADTYWLRMGAVSALAGIALQELVEFSLQIPANTTLFAVVAAIAVQPTTASHRPAIDR